MRRGRYGYYWTGQTKEDRERQTLLGLAVVRGSVHASQWFFGFLVVGGFILLITKIVGWDPNALDGPRTFVPPANETSLPDYQSGADAGVRIWGQRGGTDGESHSHESRISGGIGSVSDSWGSEYCSEAVTIGTDPNVFYDGCISTVFTGAR